MAKTQSQPSLENSSISALLQYGSNPETMELWFEFLALEKKIRLEILGLVMFTISRELDDDDPEASNVLEVRVARIQPAEIDSAAYPFAVSGDLETPLWFITIIGDQYCKIICKDYRWAQIEL